MRGPPLNALAVPALLVSAALLLSGCREDVVLLDLSDSNELPSRIGPGSRIPFDGGNYYFAGTNLPWRNFGADFGGPEGASSVAAQAEIEPLFAEARTAGATLVRWLAFAAGPPEIVGQRFSAAVKADLNAALDLAERQNVYLGIVLFSPGGVPDRVWTDREVATDLAVAIEDLIRGVSSRGRVAFWTLHEKIDLEIPDSDLARQNLVRLALGARAGGAENVALGVTSFSAAPPYCSLGADFLTITELGPGSAACASCTEYADLRAAGVNCPVAVAIHYAQPGVGAAGYRGYYDSGFAGAFVWSLNPARTMDMNVIDFPGITEFLSSVSDAELP